MKMICVVLLYWFDDANISTFADIANKIANILQIFYEINF